jgi:hypothetical protein
MSEKECNAVLESRPATVKRMQETRRLKDMRKEDSGENGKRYCDEVRKEDYEQNRKEHCDKARRVRRRKSGGRAGCPSSLD